MKRILAFAIFAAALFSGCSSRLNPWIAAELSPSPSSPGVYTEGIKGGGFSQNSNPCAYLSIVYNPGTPAQTIAAISPPPTCSSDGSFFYKWPIPAITCPSANTMSIPATVLAVDIKTFAPAVWQVWIPCNPLQPPGPK